MKYAPLLILLVIVLGCQTKSTGQANLVMPSDELQEEDSEAEPLASSAGEVSVLVNPQSFPSIPLPEGLRFVLIHPSREEATKFYDTYSLPEIEEMLRNTEFYMDIGEGPEPQ